MLAPSLAHSPGAFTQFVTLGINCCSLEHKVDKLISYILHYTPDVVCLQEVWADFPLECLVGLPYRAGVSIPQIDQRMVGIILSHICCGTSGPPPPPAPLSACWEVAISLLGVLVTGAQSGGGGGPGKAHERHPPPTPRASQFSASPSVFFDFEKKHPASTWSVWSGALVQFMLFCSHLVQTYVYVGAFGDPSDPMVPTLRGASGDVVRTYAH